MGTHVPRIACTLATLAAVGLAGLGSAHAALPEAAGRCHVAVVFDASSYADELAGLVTECHDARVTLDVPGATDCNDVAEAASALGETLPARALAAELGTSGAACDGVAPAEAAYTSCPAPCNATAITDWDSVDQCMQCLMRTHVEAFASDAFALPAVPPNDADQRCARTLYSVGDRMMSTMLRVGRKCQRDAVDPGVCSVNDLRETEKLLRLRRKSTKLVVKGCAEANVPAVAACSTSLADSGCVMAAAENFGNLLAYDAARMLGEDLPSGIQQYSQVSAGAGMTCAVRIDGAADCWGWGGDQYDVPAVPPPGTFTKIVAGGDYSCGLRPDGSVDCWGTPVYTPPAAAVPRGTFVDLADGPDWNRACGLRADGTMECWGYYGPLADVLPGTYTDIAARYYMCGIRGDGTAECSGPLVAPPGTFTQIEVGLNHACGLHDDGSIECWGDNYDGRTDAPAGTFIQLSLTFGHSCALRDDGAAVCWGSNSSGQISAPPGTFVEVSAGGGQSCGVREDGSVECWGNNDYGQSSSPVANVVQVSVSHGHACRLLADATVSCWGDDEAGQSSPPPGTFAEVAAGWDHTCGVATDGSAVCWGDDTLGESTAPAGTFEQIVSARNFSCGIHTGGTLECWGSIASPPAGSFTELSADRISACGLRDDGQILCWNAGGSFAVAGGPFTQVLAVIGGTVCSADDEAKLECRNFEFDRSVPAPSGAFVQLTGGETDFDGSTTCGIRLDGSIDCWGTLGTVPPPAGTFVQVSVRNKLRCAVRTDGREICWERAVRN